jgi:hypothetical protein
MRTNLFALAALMLVLALFAAGASSAARPALAQPVSTTSPEDDCCFPGSPCCYPGSPCCDEGSCCDLSLPCCDPPSECCFPVSGDAPKTSSCCQP